MTQKSDKQLIAEYPEHLVKRVPPGAVGTWEETKREAYRERQRRAVQSRLGLRVVKSPKL